MARLSEINVKSFLNDTFEATFMVKEVKSGKQKNGYMFLSIIMKDKDVEIEAKYFNATQVIIDYIQPGKIICGTIKVQEYDKGKDGISCIIESVADDVNGYSVADFIDIVEGYDAYLEKFKSLLNFCSDTVYGQIAYHILNKHWSKYCIWVAGKSQHHNAMGGLLMHSVCVAEGCKKLGEFYNSVYGTEFCNLKLLVSVALVHDVMKTTELDYKTTDGLVEYNQNNLSSHIVDAAFEIERAANELNIQDKYLIDEMKHCILAHHGRMEWGSPVTPYFTEAFILSRVDEIDAECWKYNKKFKGMNEHEKKVDWVGGECKIYYKPTIYSDTEI